MEKVNYFTCCFLLYSPYSLPYPAAPLPHSALFTLTSYLAALNYPSLSHIYYPSSPSLIL